MARLYIRGKAKSSNVFINTLTFRMPDGKEVVIDRDETHWEVKDGILDMYWYDCYVWDSEGAHYGLPDNFDKADLVEIDLDEDSDDVEITNITYAADEM